MMPTLSETETQSKSSMPFLSPWKPIMTVKWPNWKKSGQAFQELSKPALITAWIRLQAQYTDLETAKKLMTQNIMAQLDSGDGPLF